MTLKTQSSRHSFSKVISRKVSKKYRLLKETQSFLLYKIFRNNKNRSPKLKYGRQTSQKLKKVEQVVKAYYPSDSVSRLCPGKEETVTKKD